MIRALLLVLALLAAAPGAAIAQQPAKTATTATLAEDPFYYDPGSKQIVDMVDNNNDPSALPSDTGMGSLFAKLLQMMFVLGLVCVLAYLVLGKGLPKLMSLSPAARRGMIAAPPRGVVEVVDRLPLDPRRSLVVVRVGKSYFLVGVSEQGMTLLSRLDDPILEGLSGEKVESGSFLGRFQGILNKRMDKEG